MIFVRFLSEASGNLVGFVMEGHAGYADPGEDIVCAAVSSVTTAVSASAAVSSVAYMTANTITEIIKADTEVAVEDGMMFVKVAAGDALRCRDLLTGLKLHLIGIEEQYPDRIQVNYLEV